MSILVATVVFLCTFGGTQLGMWLRGVLPKSWLEAESKEVINVATGLLATLAALVLGLLVASAKSTFDAQETGFQELAANIIVLDRLMAEFGPEGDPARKALKKSLASTIEHLWPTHGEKATGLEDSEISAAGRVTFDSIRDINAKNDAQRALQEQAIALLTDIGRTRWLLSEQHDSASSFPFHFVLIFWLSVIFCSFGLFAPRNGVVVTAMVLCALSSAGAMFLIVDLDEPNGGLIRVYSEPLRFALSQLGQ